MSDNNNGANSGNQNQVWSRWGYDLVCDLINNGHASGTSGNGDLQQLFDYVCGHETCFLEFKATPYMPDQKFSKDNRFGYHEGESNDDYTWNVAKAVIALANTVGGGIILGISDKGHEPIPEICIKNWEEEQWDKFANDYKIRILKTSYTLFDEEKDQRVLVTIENTLCENLRSLCDIRCCRYKNHTVPLILVHTVQSKNDQIWVKKDDCELLLVRSSGDVGRTDSLTGQSASRYIQPPKDSYSPHHSSDARPEKRYWNNLSCIPEIVGRDEELSELDARLIEKDDIQWICGDAGVGKTAFIQNYIATYCHENSESPFDVAFFIDAQNLTFSESICRLTSYADEFEAFCGIQLNAGADNPLNDIFRSAEYLKPRIFKSWALQIINRLSEYPGPGKVLIVLDNVNSPTFLCDKQIEWTLDIARAKRIRFCVTARVPPASDKHVALFSLPDLTEDAALRILEEKRSIENENAAAQKIVKLCHHNARALCIIANQLESDSESDPYTRKLNELKRNGLSSSPGKGLADKELKALLAQPIDKLRQKSRNGDKTLHLFALSVWFKSDDIPADCLRDAFARFLDSLHEPHAPENFQVEWESCIDNLIHDGMIEQNPGNGTYRIESFWRDVLLTFPEPFQLWKFTFETIKQGLFTASSTDQSTLPKWQDMLIEFISLTISQSSNDPERHQNAGEIVKWIVSAEKWKELLRKLAENFGYVEKVRRVCDYLFGVAELEYYRNQQSVDSAQNYIFFLSVQKTIAAKGSHDIKSFSRISKKLRESFSRLKTKSEEQEINFAKELIYDAGQNDKFDHYEVIEKDLDHAFKILIAYKDHHIKLLVKSYIERIRIEQEFKKYRNVRYYLEQLIKLTRTHGNGIPSDIIRGFCKEQKAYMHLCQSETATPLTRWFHHWRASSRYSWLIEEMSPRPEEQSHLEMSRRLLLFKSHYFKAIALRQRGKEERAMKELDISYDLCETVFDNMRSFSNQSALLEFNKYRAKAGILRLQDRLNEAQIEDAKATDCYNNNFAPDENLYFADLKDDHGNTHALLGNYNKAIDYVLEARDIRSRLLPPTHVKIQNSASRLACLYCIRAIEDSEHANEEIRKLTGTIRSDEKYSRIITYSEVIIRKLKKLTKFGSHSKAIFLRQIRKDEQREECERVRAVIAEFQGKLFEEQTKNCTCNPT